MRSCLKSSFKKLLVVLLAFVTASMFVACGKESTGGGGNNTTDPKVAPVISGFAVQADEGAVFGKVGEAHKLSYTITGECTSETVSVKKDGAAAADSSYEYTAQAKKIVFKEAGAYVVTLTAMNGEKGSTASANVAVTAFDAPVITTTLPQTVYQDTAVDFVPAATYAAGDAADTSVVTVTYSATADGAFAEATSEQYTYADNKFTAKALGYYKITLTVTGIKGVSASEEYTVRSVGVGVMTLNHEYGTGRILVERNKATMLNYTATGGEAADYEISYEYDREKLTVTAGEGSSVSVTASADGDYAVKVIYTHKAVAEAQSDLTFNITVKEDIAAPVIDEADPFGGTWKTLIPNYGMQLYYNATDDKTTIDYSRVSYSVVGGTAQATAAIKTVAGNANYPYLVSTKEGDVVVRMTVTDECGNSSYAEKTFTVAGVGSGKTFANWSAYGNAVYGKAHGLNFDDGTSDASNHGHTTSVITKTGIIANRENVDSLDACLGLVFVQGKANFQIDYKITVIALNTSATGFNSLLMPLFAGPAVGQDAWVENFGINWSEGESTRTENGFWAGSWLANYTSTYTADPWGGKAAVGKEIYIRFTRTVSNSVVTFTLSYSLDGEAYTRAHELTYAESSTAGNAGAPVQNLGINHVDGGTFEVSNLTLQEITPENA